jgi:hypothetical protein
VFLPFSLQSNPICDDEMLIFLRRTDTIDNSLYESEVSGEVEGNMP